MEYAIGFYAMNKNEVRATIAFLILLAIITISSTIDGYFRERTKQICLENKYTIEECSEIR